MMTYTYEEAHAASVEYFKGDSLAADVFVGKYALSDQQGNLYEKTPADMHRRLAREFARIEAKYPNPMSEDEIFGLLDSWKVVPQGSPMSGIGNPYQLQSLSNCFVIESPEDSYGGILRADQELIQIMKRRGGVGLDISNIRPRGLATSNAARTTDGIGVFMERYSNSCREVAQGGRRGALMITIDVHHPEIRTFINIKRDLKKVTGANISIRLSDEFMEAVKNKTTVQLRFPVEKKAEHLFTQDINANELWDEIIEAAHGSAEPGLLFWDTIVDNSPADCYADVGYKTKSTNPCISGDTLIAVADGRNAVPIRILAEEGKDVPVYSTNTDTGQVEIKWGRNPRLTKKLAEVWRLKLDDGTELVATPEHRILKKDLSYSELKDLNPGDSIFPFNSFESNGYRQVSNVGSKMIGGGRRNRRQYRLIHEFFNGPVDPKEFAIHHANFDSYDDSIENLAVMKHSEHRVLHAARMGGKKNPYHKMTSDWKQKFAYHPGSSNGRYIDVSNERLLEAGKKIFSDNGKITRRMWISYAKKHGLPQSVSNQCRFGTWNNFANQVSANHKVISVEMVGYEDVYNITVDDNHNYHVITSSDGDRHIVSSGICVKNCGELPLSPYDSCRLLLVNVDRFVMSRFSSLDTDGIEPWFDFVEFEDVCCKAQRLMDDLIDLEIESIDRILEKIEKDPEPDYVKENEVRLWRKIRGATVNARRTGLGLTGLGDALAGMDIKYGSQRSIMTTEAIYKSLARAAYRSTIDMAEERGAFPVFDLEKEKASPFLDRVLGALDQGYDYKYEKFGRRNIALTTTAPAGSVSILTQTTSGCEPAYLLKYKRRRKITAADLEARVDFVDAMGDRWQEYTVYHHGFKKWMEVTGKTEADIEQSPYWGATSNDIDWVKKIDVQAAAQKWICHAISNTTNVPKDTTVETVKQIYMRGWETGCKGVTIYRDGCRDGVLVADTKPASKTDEDGRLLDIIESHAPKRPKELPCDIHRATVKGEPYLVIVGLFGGKPYEVFCGLQEHVEIPKKVKSGILVKGAKTNGVAAYNLRVALPDDDEIVFKNIVDLFDNPVYGTLTRTVSMALRHGIPIQYLIEQLRKDKRSDVTSFNTVVARVLSKHYLADGTKVTSEKQCGDCKGTNLQYVQGCVTCFDCGSSRCG